MAMHRRDRRTVRATHVVVACVMLAGCVLVADQARAQNLFDSFFGFFRNQRQYYQPNHSQPNRVRQQRRQQRPRLLQPIRTNSREYASSRSSRGEVLRTPREVKESYEVRGSGAQSFRPVSYCVRLCDGRYFELPPVSGAGSATPDKVCSAMCPASDTRVFSGDGIEFATSKDGKAYSALQNAFRYRDKVVNGCSCNSSGLPGMTQIDPRNDPTLEPGDIVVTRAGPMVFTGDKRPPHREREFVPVKKYRGLSKDMRRALEKMEVAIDDNFVPAQPGATAEADTPASPVGRQDKAKDTPVAATQSTGTP